MSAFILTWNPNVFQWDTIEDDISQIKKKGHVNIGWTCMSSHPKQGDEFYVFLLGTKVRGIVGYGSVDRIQLDQESPYNESGKANIVDGKLSILINPYKNSILEFETLKKIFPDQLWNPRQSGIRIKPEISEKLRELWFDFVNKNDLVSSINDNNKISEGKISQVLSTKYERNKEAREKCLKAYGYTCRICNINLFNIYGAIGKDFIHVHHINFLSQYNAIHKIDPIKDLIPVCPNCHAMLHRQYNGKYLSVEELKSIVNDRK